MTMPRAQIPLRKAWVIFGFVSRDAADILCMGWANDNENFSVLHAQWVRECGPEYEQYLKEKESA